MVHLLLRAAYRKLYVGSEERCETDRAEAFMVHLLLRASSELERHTLDAVQRALC